MVEWVTFTLRARGGPGASFVRRLSIAPGGPVRAVDGRPHVELLSVALADFAHVDTRADAGAAAEAFADAVRDGLVRAAGWLERQPRAAFEDLRASGPVADVFVGAWVTQDQFDLDLLPEFVRACALHGLPIAICTND